MNDPVPTRRHRLHGPVDLNGTTTGPGTGARLPVLDVIDQVRGALAAPGAAVLVAPPGTGKTTGVPPALLDQGWMSAGRIVVTQPRRLAARAAAAYMASRSNERVGQTFGYSVRGDRRVSPATRVELVTEGLLLRRLQSDPMLDGVSAVIVDELHERSIDVDLLLALLIDVRSSLRPDLRLLAMSATLDPAPVAALLGGCHASSSMGPDRPDSADRDDSAERTEGADGSAEPVSVITAPAPIHPVRTWHRPAAGRERLEDRVASTIREALAAGPEDDGVLGDVLAFLPGRGEIRRTAERLSGLGSSGASPVVVHELHGSVPPALQDAALRPDPDGRRRIVLATSIAETSITVEGVRIVVDSGRRRTVRVHPGTGLPGLVTEAVSMAGADQRRGRAGRSGPGTCYRLWSTDEERHRRAADRPEITSGDLSPALLHILEWGARPDDLSFLDPPSGAHLDAAWALLGDLRALDSADTGTARLNERGRALASLGFHPRLGAVVLAALHSDLRADGAAALAAVLEVDLPGEIDLVERFRRLRRGDTPREVRDAVAEWRRRIPDRSADRGRSTRPQSDGNAPHSTDLDADIARAVAAGYRDRLARRRPASRTDDRGREQAVYQLVGGGEVALRPADHPLSRSRWLAVVGLDRGADGSVGWAQLAVGVDDPVALDALADLVADDHDVTWDPAERQVTATIRRRVGAITLDERPWRAPSPELVRSALRVGLRTHGPAGVFDRWSQADELLARLAVVRSAVGMDDTTAGNTTVGPGRPDADQIIGLDAAVERIADAGRTSREQLARIDIARYLSDALEWHERQALDDLAPMHLETSNGRRLRVTYGPDGPTAATRLQDLLGCDEHPAVGGGRVPVTVELLSPAGRPLQRTADLPGFWRGSYAAVRSDMRGRYPKHRWPERPWE